jgi:hypothetical protein
MHIDGYSQTKDRNRDRMRLRAPRGIVNQEAILPLEENPREPRQPLGVEEDIHIRNPSVVDRQNSISGESLDVQQPHAGALSRVLGVCVPQVEANPS